MKYYINFRKLNKLNFTVAPSTFMHIDLNSCFATVEQQANPFLRGKPIAVAAYDSPGGCILAPSIEAKKFGIKVGMRVKDGKSIYPGLIVLSPDPNKYRCVHLGLRKILSEYTNDFFPKSIDEFVLNLKDYLHLPLKEAPCKVVAQSRIYKVAEEIKQRVKREIGEWLTVSIGIAPNRFLAKLASNLHKPDGLDEINSENFLNIYSSLKLTDLCGINIRNAARLASVGIYTVTDFYNAPLWKLKAAFKSICAYYWFLRLRGYKVDDVEFGRRSFGNSYALPEPLKSPDELSPILTKLVIKTGTRLRRASYNARGIHVSILYRDWTRWHKGLTLEKALFESRDIYKKTFMILGQAPLQKPVRELAISVFNLEKSDSSQLDLFSDVVKQEKLTRAVDEVNDFWGDFSVTPAKMLYLDPTSIPDRIAFGQSADATY